MNVTVDVNLAELGEIILSPKTGRRYLDVEALISNYGYVSETKKEPHLKLSVTERRAPSQYGETHNVKVWNKTEKTSEYLNAISVKELTFGDGNKQQTPNSNVDDIF